MKTLLRLLVVISMIIILNNCAYIKEMNREYYDSWSYKLRNPEATEFTLGKPDDMSLYSSNGYTLMSYIYYCYNGQYITVSFKRINKEYHLEDVYTTKGICK